MNGGRVEVVVTGVGAVSPFGLGVAGLWEGLLQARPAIGPFDRFDTAGHRTRVAGALPADAAEQARPPWSGSDGRRATRVEGYLLRAVDEALEQAGLRAGADALRWAGVFLGTSNGGMYEGERVVLRKDDEAGARRYGQFAGQPIGTPAATLARHLGTAGAVETVATACCASTMALEAALASLRAGEHELVVAGGADSLCEVTYAGFNSLRAVSERPARPFRADRDGLSLGEGAGILVLETREHAAARGATPLAVFAGAGSSCDAHHMTAPEPTGAQARIAVAAALADAGITPGAIGGVVAHGTGTPHNDLAEAQALQAVFGAEAAPLVTAPKGAVGHLLGGCGALEAVIAVAAAQAGALPPTAGAGDVDADTCVELVLGQARAMASDARAVLSLNLAFGGANAALVFRPAEGAR